MKKISLLGNQEGETAKSLLACKAVSSSGFRLCLKPEEEVPHEHFSNKVP
jgi:hypothetical protein